MTTSGTQFPGQNPLETNALKRRVFWLLLLLIPLAAFVIPEVVLRVAGYGENSALFQTFEHDSSYYRINEQLGRRYFPGKTTQPAVAVTNILCKQKPDGTFRIFALGASTTAGYPYLYNGAFPSILKVMLRHYYPERQIEVINMAMPAVTSYAVREIALKLDEYQPDLLLIYAGHNEFYGGLGVASSTSLGHSRWLVNTWLALRDFRLVQLLSNSLAKLRQLLADDPWQETGTLMQRMAQERTIPYNSDLFRKAGLIFRDNLQDIINHYRGRNVPVLIGTLVSNIRDQQPFVDVYSTGGQPTPAWKAAIDSARQGHEKQQLDAALIALESAIASDSLPASQYFLQGELLLAAGDTAAARTAFYRAKDHDGLRFRAAEILNHIIAEIAKQPHVTAVPVREIFESHSPAALPGNTLLLEHLHPNIDGYLLMATAFETAIRNGGYLGMPAAELPDSTWRSRIGITEVDEMAAQLRIDYLKSGWPFRSAAPPPQAQFPVPNSQHPLQKLVRQFWLDEISWEELHVNAAAYYSEQQQWEKAAEEYRALTVATDVNPSPYIFLADALTRLEQYDAALEALNKARQLEASPAVLIRTARIYLRKQSPAQALVYLQQALDAQPDDPQIHFDLARTHLLLGDLANAQIAIQRVLSQTPDNPNARKLAEMITEAQMAKGNEP